MEKDILYILSDEKSYTVNDLVKLLNVNENELRKTLQEMCDELLIYKNKKNKYVLFEKSNYLKGKIQVLDGGFGFVNYGGEKDAYISKNNLNGAKNGDLVAIELIPNSKHEAKVIKIGKKENEEYVGEIKRKNNHVYVKLDDKSLDYVINLDSRTCNLVDGMKVVVSLKGKENAQYYQGEVIEVLGHKDDPGVDLLSVLRKYKIDGKFPEEVKNQVLNIPGEVSDEEITKLFNRGGKDLRHENVFTIDGDDTKDIDDAISISILPSGEYNLKVHIANVSHYVQPGTPIFNEAVYKRGTSIYIPGSSVPMLPRELSNGICSLNPDVDRLALTFDMTFDSEGNFLNYQVYESVIKSRKQMTYKKVNKILEEGIVPEGYEEFAADLLVMYSLSKKLRAKRRTRGFIEFDLNENKIYLDDKGKTVDIKLYPRGEAEKLIEDFMVETGERTSKFLDENGYDNYHVYRVHDIPSDEKVSVLESFLANLGYTCHIENISPEEYQRELDSYKDKDEYPIIARFFRNSMKKAQYSKKNIGHFALASLSTCQVTSPIRRAGDLGNHVLIKDAIYHKAKTFSEADLSKMCIVASTTERNADACEVAANKIKTAEYMLDHVEEEYEGMITGFCKEGLIVEINNLIEGIVPIASLKDDSYDYYKEKFAYIGRRTRHRYGLGDKVTIKVKGASKQDGTVTFEILSKENAKIKKRV